MYYNSERLEDAMLLFSEFTKLKSPVLWTAMISGNIQNDCCEEALLGYQEMRKFNVMPDQATFASALKACSTLASMQDGRKIHSLIFHTGFDTDELTRDKSHPSAGEIQALLKDLTALMKDEGYFADIGSVMDGEEPLFLGPGYVSLKKADIGIAVDDATDAARSASDIVLTEPGLSVIISAGLTSRAIFQRMKNYMLGFMLLALIWKFDFLPSMVLIMQFLMMRVFGVSTLEKTATDDFRKLASAIYLQVATLIVVYANWSFAAIEKLTGVELDGKAWDLVFENRIAFTRKDFGKEQHELQWAHAQRTLHGLQVPEPEIFRETTNFNELNQLAEEAKRRAEIARLRELHTLKGHVESVVKLKGLDIETIKQCGESWKSSTDPRLPRMLMQLYSLVRDMLAFCRSWGEAAEQCFYGAERLLLCHAKEAAVHQHFLCWF
ncbi:hypothetical protein K7X08_002364 [Anisodus acutangulus]|uniref:Pentatricopeptide repeat-containing protein n=1 Tax=Anisodus acutangulus TaxID=402998 RepID=A0A9Q1R5E7_9SOLA|nr:hypothetical protein K7X08_002364 [Anisodus acutangulus]